MRILHAHTRYRQPGGEDRVVEAERSLLAAAGHTVVEYNAANAGDLTAAAQFATSAWNLSAANQMKSLLETTHPEVAHLHNTWFASSPSIVSAIARRGVPSVMTLHNYRLTCIAATLSRNHEPCELCVGGSGWNGVRYRCYQDRLTSSIVALLGTSATRKTALGRVTTFAVLTEFARSTFVRAGFDPDRIVVVPNFTGDPGPRQSPPSDSDTIIFVGRLSPEKGIDRYLETWTNTSPDLRMEVIGDGPLADDLRSRYPNVTFLGRLEAGEVGSRLLEARCLVFPSTWYEGQSLVLLEAMAAGLPVLASNWSPIADTVGSDAAILIDATDRDGWEAAIEAVSDDALVKKMSTAGRSRWEANHSPGGALARLESLYRRTLHSSQNGSAL